jgi:predicted CXXCH cytochrome family protein
MMKSRTVIHEPVAKDCGYCHNAHNSKYKSLLYKPMDELCVTCHTDQKTEMHAKVQHDPVTKDKICRNCHETHGANIKKRLLAPEDQLCVECHGGKKKPAKDDKGRVLANIKALQGKKVKHGPFGENNCSECHNSHGGKYFRLLVADYPAEFYAKYTDETYSFCYQCHKKERITEPKTTTLTGFRDGDKNLHYAHVVKPESGRSCRSCHEDHATERNHLIRASVPYGPQGWKLELNFVETKTGGRCSETCHDNKKYNNNGSSPKDVAIEYKKKKEREKKKEQQRKKKKKRKKKK